MNVVWVVLAGILVVVISVALIGAGRALRRSSSGQRVADRQNGWAVLAEQRREARAARALRKDRRRAERDRRVSDALRNAQQQQRRPPPETETEIEFETRRPTVTRTAAGGLLGGPVGAVIGLAWRKKRKQTIRIPR